MQHPATLESDEQREPALAYALPAPEVLRRLEVDAGSGLSAQEAAARLKKHGPNALLTEPKASPLTILANQLKSPVMALLLAAAAIAALFGEWTEAGAILLVLAINTLIGFLTELHAARSMEALRKLGHRSARVKRDGKLMTIAAEAVVPGDIVVLDAGDVITADLRLVEARNLCCDESTLTGRGRPRRHRLRCRDAVLPACEARTAHDRQEAFCREVPDEANTSWVRPKLVGEVKFTEWTGKGEMRHPVFLGLRTDKKASDVVKEEPRPETERPR